MHDGLWIIVGISIGSLVTKSSAEKLGEKI